MSSALRRRPMISAVLVFIFAAGAAAQGTAFTYQGKLTDGDNVANGEYDLQFKLFDTMNVGSGTQQGSTYTAMNVAVISGVFTVQLDFEACATCFDGTARFLEIDVRKTTDATYTTLSPRQPVTATPYALRSLNATAADGLSVACVNCVTSSQIASVLGSAVTGTIPVASVPDLSASYVKNTTSQQASANFNIIGTGTAGTFNATTQYNIGGSRVLGAPGTNNLFAGLSAGQANTSGASNAFVGASAGLANTIGANNAFFGFNAGRFNVGDAFSNGSENSFFGSQAGQGSTGSQNSFFGRAAGAGNQSGSFNSFFGSGAGLANTGGSNSFFGANAGLNNTADGNSFFGLRAGFANTSGTSNSFFGYQAGQNNTTEFYNTFLGYGAGQSNGLNDSNALASANTFVGSVAGSGNTMGYANSFFGASVGTSNTVGFQNSFYGVKAGDNHNTTEHDNTFIGYYAGVNNGTNDTNPPNANYNTFVGSFAGESNASGGSNTMIGFNADVGANNLINATAIGANAAVALSNSLVLGSINGVNGALSDTNVGIGTSAPGFKLHLAGHTTHDWPIIKLQNVDAGGHSYWLYSGANGKAGDLGIYDETAGAYRLTITDSGNIAIGTGASVASGVTRAIAIGAGVSVSSSNSIQIGGSNDTVVVPGNFGVVGTLHIVPSGSSDTPLCRDNAGLVTFCSSSLRYKTEVRPFLGGLEIINRLRPISFNWKSDHTRSLGLGAEEIADVEPLLVTHNDKGEIEGVKYAQLSAVFINAFKQQQAQISRQQRKIDQLRRAVRQLQVPARRQRRAGHR